MVDKINAIDATTSAKKVKEITKDEEKAEKIKKQEEADKAKKTKVSDEFKSPNAYFNDAQLKIYVKDYINRLIEQYNDNDIITNDLRAYLMHFDVDKFKKTFPDMLSTTRDIATALHQQTLKFL